jgi:transposase
MMSYKTLMEKHNFLMKNRDLIIEKVKQGMSQRKIGKEFKVCSNAISDLLKNYGYEKEPIIKTWKKPEVILAQKSPELIAQQKVNSLVNQKYIKNIVLKDDESVYTFLRKCRDEYGYKNVKKGV